MPTCSLQRMPAATHFAGLAGGGAEEVSGSIAGADDDTDVIYDTNTLGASFLYTFTQVPAASLLNMGLCSMRGRWCCEHTSMHLIVL